MAHISRYPLLRHLRSTPTTHIVTMRRGSYRPRGTGVSFWFRPLTAVISEVPVDDRELPMAFRARTADFQDVSVQGTVTYRVTDPAVAAQRVDFSIDTKTGVWRGSPLQQIAGLMTETAQQHALDLIAHTKLADALSTGMTAVRDRISEGMAADSRLAATGLEVVGVRVVAIRPEEEVERALQTPAREQIQQEADKATYERRALAVERERTISENELQSQIELAKREEQLVNQRGANARREAEEQAAAAKVANDARVERDATAAASQAKSIKLLGEAEAAADKAKVDAYAGVSAESIFALAARDAAEHLPRVGTLVVSPDLISTALANLAGGQGGGGGAAPAAHPLPPPARAARSKPKPAAGSTKPQ